MKTGRKLTFTREKKFMGSGLYCLVHVDGKNLGDVPNGETATNTVSTNAHSIYVVFKAGDTSLSSNEVTIPANDLDYHFHITYKPGWLRDSVELTEDETQASYNRQIIENRNRINDIVSTVNAVIKLIIESNVIGQRDFSPINKLDAQYKNSDYFKQKINNLRSGYFKGIATNYFEGGVTHSTIYAVLKEITSFTGESIETFESLKHYDYMITRRNLINSVLTLNTIEDLDKIKNRETISDIPEKFTRTYSEAKKYCELGYYEKSVNKLLFTEFTDEDLDNAKRWLLFAALIEGTRKETSDLYNQVLKLNKLAFGDEVRDEKKRSVEVKSIDMIIAEAIRLSYVNSIDKINDTLDDFLNVGCKCFMIGQEQYNILLNIFTFLQAYKQEEMVLEAMVSNCIERTAEQEERLHFLKNKRSNYNGNGTSSFKPVELQEVPDDKTVYEYRSVSWKEADINSYFDSLSMQNQTVSIPFVVNEWSKNINASGIKWDIVSVAKQLKKVLQENFDDRFRVGVIESGPTGNYTEYDKTALITDTIISGYPWIVFNVIGEQMMKNQVTLSIYAMYMPEFDMDLMDISSIIEKNDRMCKKILMLNQKQNPKVNNYMMNVTDLIIKELEKWINTQSESDIYG